MLAKGGALDYRPSYFTGLYNSLDFLGVMRESVLLKESFMAVKRSSDRVVNI